MTEPCHFQGDACIHCQATEQGECEGWNAPAITPEFARRAALREALAICQEWERSHLEVAKSRLVTKQGTDMHNAMARSARQCASEILDLIK